MILSLSLKFMDQVSNVFYVLMDNPEHLFVPLFECHFSDLQSGYERIVHIPCLFNNWPCILVTDPHKLKLESFGRLGQGGWCVVAVARD